LWPFCLIDTVFCLTEALQFYEAPFVDSWFSSTSHCCLFRNSPPPILPLSQVSVSPWLCVSPPHPHQL
jgi:hypothetical protein